MNVAVKNEQLGGKKISVSLVEDHRETARDFAALLYNSKDFRLIDVCTSGEEALKKIPASPPALLVLDLGLPGIDGIQCLHLLKSQLPELKIVVYSVFEDENTILEAILNGANGYLLKDTMPELLLAELKVVHLGGAPLTPRVANRIIKSIGGTGRLHNKNTKSPLTPRESELLKLISLGFKYDDIAEQLVISVHTVRRHIESIYQKLNVHSRIDAVMRGKRFGWFNASENDKN